MKTVPLHGKKAAGRVTRIDDGDHDFAMQHRWRVSEHAGTTATRPWGPYAVTTIGRRTVGMHTLLTGWPLTDHADHDGLNNQRYNLRPATKRQNGQNSHGRIVSTSRFKGVYWDSKPMLWKARICVDGQYRWLRSTSSELEAAYAYDAAAREHFGEFACTNFPEGPAQAMRDEWESERKARAVIAAENNALAMREGRDRFWAQREPEVRVCAFCGGEYQSRHTGVSLYCHPNCRAAAGRRRRRESSREG